MFAFKEGVTVLDEATMNGLISLSSFRLIYEGTQRTAKTGSGIVENSVADFNYAIRFNATGTTEVGRIELEMDRDNAGSDLVVQIRSGFDIAGTTMGILLKEICLPKEFIPVTNTYMSIPIGLTGLTSGGTYWIIVLRRGDSTNKIDLISETTHDASNPSYRRAGTTGGWTTNNSIHFRVLSGTAGEFLHGLYGSAYTTIRYSGELISEIWRFMPPPDGYEGGVRNILTYDWSGEFLVGGEV